MRCLGLAVLIAFSTALAADADPPARQIEVRAVGETVVPADQLILPVSIVTTGSEALPVKERNDLLLKQLFDLLAAQKLARPDIESTTETFNFSTDEEGNDVAPKQKFQAPSGKGKDPFEPRRAEPPLRLTRQLTLRFESLSQATALLAKMTALDAVRKTNEVQLAPLRIGLKDARSQSDEARLKAVRLCKEKATQLAQASELKLGPPIAIYDESASSSYPHSVYLPPDPFGEAPLPAGHGPSERSGRIEFAAFQAPKPAADAEPPPGQVRTSVGVRIVYEAEVEGK
jgi:uncharacterized protein YggE